MTIQILMRTLGDEARAASWIGPQRSQNSAGEGGVLIGTRREVREGLKDRRFGRFEAGPPPNPLSCACTSAARVAAARHKVRCEQ